MESEIEIIKPKPGPWGAWATIGFCLAIFAGWFAAQNLVAIVYAVVKVASNPDVDIFQFVKGLTSDGFVISLMTIVSASVGVGMILIFAKIRKGLTVWEYLGLTRISKKTLITAVAVFVGLIVIATILGQFTGSAKDSAFAADAYNTSIWPALFGVAVVVFAPAFEEALFRGFLFTGLLQSSPGRIGTMILTSLLRAVRRYRSKKIIRIVRLTLISLLVLWAAHSRFRKRLIKPGVIIFTSVLWASLHIQYDLSGMATILVLGLVLGAVRLKTGSLWATFIIHASWNLVAILGVALSVK